MSQYLIRHEWNGRPIKNHDPVEVTLSSTLDSDHVVLSIVAPFFNDLPPDCGPGDPCNNLYDYEVVEVFFLNDLDQYLEVEVAPGGQHLVLLLNGRRNPLMSELPLETEAVIEGSQWRGKAKIPKEYFPPNVTKFNAYCIHYSGKNRTYEALHPADDAQKQADFHALQYFGTIDAAQVLCLNESASKLWSSV